MAMLTLVMILWTASLGLCHGLEQPAGSYVSNRGDRKDHKMFQMNTTFLTSSARLTEVDCTLHSSKAIPLIYD